MSTTRELQAGTAAPAGSAPHLPGGEDEAQGPLRRILLALILLGTAGLTAELLLLEHTESLWQWLPLAALGCALLGGVAVAVRATPRTVRSFQVIMAVLVVIGLLGLYLHYDGNTEFELEMDSAVRGLELFWRSLHGATPVLAPGALAQLGLLGLAYTHRHPALRRRRAA